MASAKDNVPAGDIIGTAIRQGRNAMRSRVLPTPDFILPGHAALVTGEIAIVNGVTLRKELWAGRYRGMAGIEDIDVEVDDQFGAPARDVASAVDKFHADLQTLFNDLDAEVSPRADPSPQQELKLLNLGAWAHTSWIRIHPFVDGNGRTARLWVNLICMRYGRAPIQKLKPRPGGDYSRLAGEAMRTGDWRPFSAYLQKEFNRTHRISE